MSGIIPTTLATEATLVVPNAASATMTACAIRPVFAPQPIHGL